MNIAIFDFEGTLVDFQWQLEAAMDEVYPLIEDSIESYDLNREFIEKADYCRLYNYLQKNIPAPDRRREIIGKIDEVFDYFDTDAASRWAVYPEVHQLLSVLKGAGWNLAIASNVGRKALDLMLDKFSLNDYFQLTVSRNDVALLKPEIEGLDRIKTHFQKSSPAAGQTWMVGDSVTDIETARRAAIKVAILINGEDKTERLKQHRPDHLMDNLSQLEELLLSN